MPNCYVWDCPNRMGKKNGEVRHVFTISKNATAEVREAWLRNIPTRPNNVPFSLERNGVCNEHFEEKYIKSRGPDLTINGKIVPGLPRQNWSITLDAVPTKFPPGELENASKEIARRSVKRKLPPPSTPSVYPPAPPQKTYQKIPATSVGNPTPSNLKSDSAIECPAEYSFCTYCCTTWTDYNKNFGDPKRRCETMRKKLYSYRKFAKLVSKYLGMKTPLPNCVGIKDRPIRFRKALCSLCEPCLHEISKVCHLYDQLEEARMKLELKMKSFANKLEQPDRIKLYQGLKTVVSRNRNKQVAHFLEFNEEFKSIGVKLLNASDADTETLPEIHLQVDNTEIKCEESLELSQTVKLEEPEAEEIEAPNSINDDSLELEQIVKIEEPAEAEGIETLKSILNDDTRNSPKLQTPKRSVVLNEQNTDSAAGDNPTTLSEARSRPEDEKHPQSLNSPSSTAASSNSATDSIIVPPAERQIKDEVIPDKVAFMSPAYVGKYRVVCKLKNLKTGETCFGVVGKTQEAIQSRTVTDSNKQSSSSSSAIKVLSLKPAKKSKISFRKLQGPPYKCPLPSAECGCTEIFETVQTAKTHVNRMRYKIKVKERKEKRRKESERKKQERLELQEAERQKQQVLERQRKELAEGSAESGEDQVHGLGVKARFNCELCSAKFWVKTSLDCHMKCHTDFPAPCTVCHQTYDLPTTLLTHELTHVRETERIAENTDSFFCPRCTTVCKNRKRLQRHYDSVHLKIMLKSSERVRLNRQNFCVDCNRKFFDVRKYVKHRKVYHDDQDLEQKILPLACQEPNCGKRYPGKIHLQRHHHMSHQNAISSLIKCHLCKRSFAFRKNFERHMRNHAKWEGTNFNAGGEKQTFNCELCDKSFKLAGYLSNHMLQEHRGDSIASGSGNSSSSKEHNKMSRRPPVKKTKSPLICEICGKQEKLAYFLKIHMSRIHNVGDCPQRLDCPFHGCKKAFFQKMTLEDHISRHEGRPQYKCCHCGKDLYTNASLQRHELAHRNEETNPFKCHLCGKGFALPEYLAHHVKTHDPNRVKRVRKPKIRTPESRTTPDQKSS